MKHYDVVAALIECEGKYLCMQRGQTRYAYTSFRYEFPGGKVELGETEEEALHREIREEMGCEIEIVRRLRIIDHAYPDFSVTLAIYLCRTERPEFQLREHVAFCWLPREEMPRLPWVEADREFVESLSP